jgi:glycerol kinase
VSRYILAIDQGTTSSRSILFDHAGAAIAISQREFTQHFPQPGWVEHDAVEIWRTQSATIADVLGRAGATIGDVAAIGIANQRETTVLWDRRTGLPVAPAIVWQDRRTAQMCASLRAGGLEPEIVRRTGLLLDPYFSGTKLAWLLEQSRGVRARAERGELAFGTIDCWLIWNLTGGAHHLSDVTNASRTMLFNIHSGQWDDELLERLRIPPAVLPQVVPSMFADRGVVAQIDGREVCVAGAAGDQQAALFGQGCLTPGMAKNTYGTGCFLLMNTGPVAVASQHRLLTTIAWDLGGRSYALEGSVFVGGAVVQWLRDGLGIIAQAADVEALAGSVNDSHGVIFVPAFTGLGSPHWDADARGIIVGLSRGATRAHIARAALDAIAFQCAEVLAAMQQDAAQPLRELRVDGGATANNLLMQIQADLLGVPVIRPRVTETTALGAAYFAGLAVGYWSTPAELAANRHIDRLFEPAISRDEAASRMHQWSRAVERAGHWHDDGTRAPG